MPQLVKISGTSPNAVPIWAFHDPIDVTHVAAALGTIAKDLRGAGYTIDIMSGTHGYCKGKVGVVATREEKFADEDRRLAAPKTGDNQPVTVAVHDFNTNLPAAPDRTTAVMAKLNQDMRKITDAKPGKHIFLLAYCCSAASVQPGG